MSRVTSALLSSIAALALPLAAHAAEAGLYGTLRGGAVVPGDMNYSNRANSDLLLDVDTGWSIGGVLGYRFTNGFRTALEVDYADSSLKGTYRENLIAVPCGTVAAQPCLGPAVDGDIRAWSGFAMAYYDFDLGSNLTPYIGGGVGLVRTGLDVDTTARLNNGTSSRFAIIDDADTELGYRAAAGVAYNLSDTTQIEVGYSYTRTGKPAYAARGSAAVAFTVNSRYDAHAFTAGVRIGF